MRGRVGRGLFARRQMRKLGKQRAVLRLIPASKGQARHGGRGKEIVERQAVLIENEPRLKPLENIAELIAVHLDVHGAHRRAGRHHAEIAQQVLDRIIGKERDPVVATESAWAQEGGETADDVAQLPVADAAVIFRRHQPGLVRAAARGPLDPVSQQFGPGGFWHLGMPSAIP